MIFADEHKGKVTAGLPSLLPEHRGRISYQERQDFKQKAMLSDAEAKKQMLTAPDGDIPTTVLEAQLGRPMPSGEIVKRLQKLNPNLLFERSIADPTTMGIYVADSKVTGGRRFLMGFESGFSPEYTVNGKDASGRYRETRGWRQIIARLVRLGHLNLAAAEQSFNIARGRQSHNWQTLTT